MLNIKNKKFVSAVLLASMITFSAGMINTEYNSAK